MTSAGLALPGKRAPSSAVTWRSPVLDALADVSSATFSSEAPSRKEYAGPGWPSLILSELRRSLAWQRREGPAGAAPVPGWMLDRRRSALAQSTGPTITVSGMRAFLEHQPVPCPRARRPGGRRLSISPWAILARGLRDSWCSVRCGSLCSACGPASALQQVG